MSLLVSCVTPLVGEYLQIDITRQVTFALQIRHGMELNGATKPT